MLNLTPTAGGSTLGGIVANPTLARLYIVNAEAIGGTDNIVLVNQSGSETTASRRFVTSSSTNLIIPPGGMVACYQMGGSVGWQCGGASLPDITSRVLQNTTPVAVSGCTPSASSLGPSGGQITQPATPCTTVTFTFAVTAPHGWNCLMGDQTQTNAGFFYPPWVQASNSATTCVMKIPSGAQVASDALTLQAGWY